MPVPTTSRTPSVVNLAPLKLLERLARAIVRRAVRRGGNPPLPGPPQLRMRYEFGAAAFPVPPLPPSCHFESYSRGGEAGWVELLNRSGEFGEFTRRKLSAEVLKELVPHCGVFVVHEGQRVATASACSFAANAPCATLMYVVVAPEHRGKGLGAAVTAEVLERCRRAGFSGVVLQTDDYRLPAIRTYMKLGFVPLHDDPATRARWDALSLDNPRSNSGR